MLALAPGCRPGPSDHENQGDKLIRAGRTPLPDLHHRNLVLGHGGLDLRRQDTGGL
jgi:hypothetical protein